MTDLAERLKMAMAGPPEIKPSELAKACDIKQPSINDWLNGRTKKMEGANLLAASECLNVNPLWLATGRGAMRAAMSQKDIRDVMRILQAMSEETRRTAVTLVKALENQILENVNSAPAENGGTITGTGLQQAAQGVDNLGPQRKRVTGVTSPSEEIAAAARQKLGVERVPRSTKKNERKSS